MSSKFKRLIMWGMLFLIPVGFIALPVLGYYSFHKIRYADVFCSPFAVVDDEIGWVLKPDAQSCYRSRIFRPDGERFFDSKIYTDENGFRSAQPGGVTPDGPVMAIGDSWTFGFGVDYPQSYPGQLGKMIDLPVVTLASPAYGSAQAIALAERWLPVLKPKALVYLDNGFWERSACSGREKPRFILKPCYWKNPQTRNIELVFPPNGLITSAAKWGLKPGGMLGAGEAGWDYFLISRPILRLAGYATRLGLIPGMGHDFKAVGVDVDAIKKGVIEHLGRLAKKASVPLIFLDPTDVYADQIDELAAADTRLIYIDSRRWQEEVDLPARSLGSDELSVPHDGHYGPGMNHLIAALVARELGRLNLGK